MAVEFPYMFMIASIGLMLGIVWTLLWSGAVFGNLVARALTWFALPPDEELRIGSIGFATLGGQVRVCARACVRACCADTLVEPLLYFHWLGYLRLSNLVCVLCTLAILRSVCLAAGVFSILCICPSSAFCNSPDFLARAPRPCLFFPSVRRRYRSRASSTAPRTVTS
jgi:hypothetical protein